MKENGIVGYQTALEDIKQIITLGQKYAYQAANKAMVLTYWQIGKRIVKQEQKGEERAAYGKQLIHLLSEELTRDFGKGFSERNIRNFRKFYVLFPDEKIWQTCLPNLTWSHVCCLLRERICEGRMEFQNTGQKYWYAILLSFVAISEKRKSDSRNAGENKGKSTE